MKLYGKVALVCLLTSAIACTKKDGANQNIDPNKQEGSNYMSDKPGSWWLFGARTGEITRRVATGKDSTKNGLKFSYFEKIDENPQVEQSQWKRTPEYFGKNEGKYVSLFDMDGSQTNYVTLVFLQEGATEWTNTQDYNYQNTKINLLTESKVELSDGTLTLGDTTYEKVTKVHHTLKGKIALMPNYLNAGTLDIWFAKGIGIIKQDVDVKISIFGNTYAEKKYTDSLLSYHIAE